MVVVARVVMPLAVMMMMNPPDLARTRAAAAVLSSCSESSFRRHQPATAVDLRPLYLGLGQARLVSVHPAASFRASPLPLSEPERSAAAS